MDVTPAYIVVIRSSDERTEELCQQIVKNQAEGHGVITIHEKPFKRALEEGYRIAIQKKSLWLITVDADMLLLPNALEQLYSEAEKMPEHYIQLQGRIFDNISGNIRKAGPRIYRVSLLTKALTFSEQSEDTIRPESSVISAMSDAGHPSRYISFVTCLHDFEQYYTDLYRKSIVHAKKHKEIVSGILLRAVDKMNSDPDFKVILKAIWDGLMNKQEVFIDTRVYQKKASSALLEMGLTEKAKLDEKFNYIEFLSDNIPEKITNQSSDITFHDQPIPQYSFMRRILNICQKKGVVEGLLFGVSSLLISAGNRLKR